MTVHVLTLSTGTSRGRETDGYTIVRLLDETTGKRYRCMGGGYDMQGTVFGEWLQDVYQRELREIADQAYSRTVAALNTDNSRDPFTLERTVNEHGLYGMSLRADGSVYLDGACGMSSMERIAKALQLRVQWRSTPRGRTVGFTVTDMRGEL